MKKEQTGHGRQLAAILNAYVASKKPPPRGRCTGHVAIKPTAGPINVNFSRNLADQLQRERDCNCALMSRLRGVSIESLKRDGNMVTTNLRDSIRFERRPGAVPARVIEYYLGHAQTCVREHMPLLLDLLQGTPRCCVPAAIIYRHLYGGELIVGRLGFSDYDWEFGEHGVAWV